MLKLLESVKFLVQRLRCIAIAPGAWSPLYRIGLKAKPRVGVLWPSILELAGRLSSQLEDYMDSRHFEPIQTAAPHDEHLTYLLVFVMILLSVVTGVFSWGFVVPQLFM
ncbi:MAG: hypothetical protein HC805_01480 [Alkalinema sp. RL_2_19]|nr:hypothetical protein [Alkalinema sp. RL_2_19]